MFIVHSNISKLLCTNQIQSTFHTALCTILLPLHLQYEYRGEGYEKKKKKKKTNKEEDDQEQDDSGKKSDGDNGLDSPDTAAETDKPETDVDR